MSLKRIEVVILAAGKGTRMYSDTPKVLHGLAGKALVQHVIDTAKSLSSEPIHLIFGHGGDSLKEHIIDSQLDWTEQSEQLGTGHAVKQLVNKINPANDVLILYGDVPLISKETLAQLIELKSNSDLALLTAKLNHPHGYGRILRNQQGHVVKIVEEKDASSSEKEINEINSGILIADGSKLIKWLKQLNNNNAQNEYYLTDIVEFAVNDKCIVNAHICPDPVEIEGINNKLQLSKLERVKQKMNATNLMLRGVTMADPSRFDFRSYLDIDKMPIGQDSIIDINVIIEGNCSFGNRVSIGANTIIKNSIIGDDVIIHENCIIENSIIENACQIGPLARLRPETRMLEGAKAGNFVEIKKSTIGKGSKVNHLTYIGDTSMGDNVNIGAGTITCNYDGAYKHQTTIGDNVFVGSNSALVAPVVIEENATIGAGTTLTRNAKKDSLCIARAKHQTIENWPRPVKTKG